MNAKVLTNEKLSTILGGKKNSFWDNVKGLAFSANGAWIGYHQ